MKDILKKLAVLADEADTAGHAEVANQIDGIIKAFAEAEVMPNPTGPVVGLIKERPVFVPNRDRAFLNKYMQYEKLSEEEKRTFLKNNPDFVKNMGHLVPPTEKEMDADIEAQIAEKEALDKKQSDARRVKTEHEKARQMMQKISDLYTKSNPPRVFLGVVPPPGKMTGKAILDFLNLGKMGHPLNSWQDMHERLKALHQKANEYLIGIGDEKDPFDVELVLTTPPEDTVKRRGIEPGTFSQPTEKKRT